MPETALRHMARIGRARRSCALQPHGIFAAIEKIDSLSLQDRTPADVDQTQIRLKLANRNVKRN
jgi:hypothetical protein